MRRWGPNGPAEVMPALSHRRWKGRRGADRLSLVTSATEAADSTSYRLTTDGAEGGSRRFSSALVSFTRSFYREEPLC